MQALADEKLVSWDQVQVSIRFGVVVQVGTTFVEPEVKNVEILMVVVVPKLLEVGG